MIKIIPEDDTADQKGREDERECVRSQFYGTKAYSLSTLTIITLILCKGF